MSPRHVFTLPVLLCAAPLAVAAGHHDKTPDQAVPLHAVTVQADTVDTPPIEGVTVHIDRAAIRRHNTVEVEDILAFAPNLTIRKRHIGDPNAIIGGRAAGTLQSARSLVYVDGLLLSDFLDSGYANPPRWGMVPPQAITSIDVLYGPFSALYPGNSLGTTVLLHTRLPDHFQASAEAQVFSQHFSDAYNDDTHFGGHALRAMLGNRHGRWRWRLSASRLDNRSQPLQYATADAGGDASAAVPVTGATRDRNPGGRPRLIAGPTSMTHTRQTQASLKLGVALTHDLDATFTLGFWHNHATNHGRSLLRDADGHVVDHGAILVDGDAWTLSPSAFAPSSNDDTQRLLGLQLDGRIAGDWHWQAIASRYDYLVAREHDAASTTGNAGTVADNHGSGWQTWDLRASGPLGQAHTLSVGAHMDRYVLDSRVHAASHWSNAADGPLTRAFAGRTRTWAVYAQDAWNFLPAWTLTLGARAEHWRAYDGQRSDAAVRATYPSRRSAAISPKAALAWDFADGWQLRLSTGRAVRFPTVGELFQGSISNHVIVDNDPNLAPERAWATDLTLHRRLANGHWRISLFSDDIRDSLYKQTDITVTPSIRRVENIDRVRIRGVAAALQLRDVWLPGLDLAASVAFNDAKTLRDTGFPLADGKYFPRFPRVRAKLTANWRFATGWALTLDGRHSGRQYASLDNSDYIDTFGAVSSFTVFDAKLRWNVARHWMASIGVDNLTDRHYWVYHPWPGRTWLATLRWSKP